MKVGDLVDVNQTRGTGSYKHNVPRGLGVVVSFQETEDLVYPNIRWSYQLGTHRSCLVEHGRNGGIRSQE